MGRPNNGGTERSTQRIEAFSDGVFAIAITLLILDLRIPAREGSDAAGLLNAILGLWPSYFAYALSFTMIGIYWANHHYLFKLFAKTDHGLNLLNLLLLMFIAFLPFPTHVLGTHWPDEASRPVAVTLPRLPAQADPAVHRVGRCLGTGTCRWSGSGPKR